MHEKCWRGYSRARACCTGEKWGLKGVFILPNSLLIFPLLFSPSHLISSPSPFLFYHSSLFYPSTLFYPSSFFPPFPFLSSLHPSSSSSHLFLLPASPTFIFPLSNPTLLSSNTLVSSKFNGHGHYCHIKTSLTS